MNKKPPELPNIEDATLRACLAPLMDVMHARAEHESLPVPVLPASPPPVVASGSNDNLRPAAALISGADRGPPAIPETLGEWRLQSDDEFAALRLAEVFLAMSDAELLTATAEYPKQIGGTMARMARIKRRLATQYDLLTAAVAVLERAARWEAADPAVD